jgi:hypothetical protein
MIVYSDAMGISCFDGETALLTDDRDNNQSQLWKKKKKSRRKKIK